MKELVKQLDLGSSVAEFDESLSDYFVETDVFRQIVDGSSDVIAGDKGTGKSALFRMLASRYTLIPEMVKIEVLTGFNPSGNPVFQRLAQQKQLTEGQYATVWKAYVLSLVGNWLLDLYEGEFTPNMQKMDSLLSRTGLRSADDSAQTVFSKIVNIFGRLFNPKSAEVHLSLSETGIPIIVPKLEFEGKEEADDEIASGTVSHETALRLLNTCIEEADITIWVALDRLDEAFQGFPDTEIPALRALFRTYLDLLEFDRISLKIFVRRDLFRKITKGGFVNLTHVNARKTEIVWEEEDLLNLLCTRIRGSGNLSDDLTLEGLSDSRVFNAIFPDQVDGGVKKPKTWAWIMSRIRDGNGIKPPRNLIDLVIKARDAQLRREEREPRKTSNGSPLIEPDSLKRGLARLSSERVEDTLLAEAGELSEMIQLFRNSKAEHNQETLKRLLSIFKDDEFNVVLASLIELGFIEDMGSTYKIPMLYRDGLDITQGKAFTPA